MGKRIWKCNCKKEKGKEKMKIYPRDIIAIFVLTGCGFLIYKGIDSFVTGITALIIGYYFSKRVYEEKHLK